MALDATPGGSSSNAYCTVAEASVYLAERLHVEPWYPSTVVSEGYGGLAHQREAALIWATQLLDDQVRWKGQPATTTQALAWPQTGQVDRFGRPIANTLVPEEVKRATAYYALALLRDTSEVPGATQTAVKRKRIGQTEIEYAQPAQAAAATRPAHQGIPSEIRALLWPYGRMAGGVNVPLLRT